VGNGYNRISLNRGNWTILDKVASYAKKTFLATGEWGSCYGYFIATSSDNSGVLIGFENFSNGPYFVENEDEIDVTPNINLLA
jgi:hypothetical protein